MTPGILAAQRARVAFTVHEYEHDPAAESYGNEAVEKTGANPDQVFKTLVVSLDGKDLAVAVVPVSAMLSLKLIARAAGAKKATMADKQLVQRTTGYVLGGVSPLGQKKQLKTFIDDSASNFATLFVSAGKRGLEIELAPEDLARLTGATFAPLQQD
ncbi:aminoacyl-tRNA deacylase [Marinobacter vinifirmus]|uniref:Cys-tRNA(Pro)/Cys-tRNA(Cys) deacylase n=1 Tax=Marinobacter vinifirmus TaxID=355591 RepID=A0A7Z1DXQ3_9GAMM|nr:Cys-tRNA(Pro) deacylase [Marinobacter vinifirmus]OZC36827.1 aminoacyl-tRNA deacylase [Marinobacter vinifirmus]